MITIKDAVNSFSVYKDTFYEVEGKSQKLKDIYVVMSKDSPDLDDNQIYVQFLFKYDLIVMYLDAEVYTNMYNIVKKDDDLVKKIKKMTDGAKQI